MFQTLFVVPSHPRLPIKSGICMNKEIALGGYYGSIVELTPKNYSTETKAFEPQDSGYGWLYSPYLYYVVGIAFVVFLAGAIIIQALHKLLDLKRLIGTFVLALFISSIPLAMRTSLEATRYVIKAAPDDLPRQIEIEQVAQTVVNVRWKTQDKKLGSIRISEAPFSESTSWLVIANAGIPMTSHEVHIEGLHKQKTYEFEILSGKTWYNHNGQPIRLTLE